MTTNESEILLQAAEIDQRRSPAAITCSARGPWPETTGKSLTCPDYNIARLDWKILY
jgi:hypothetical protein